MQSLARHSLRALLNLLLLLLLTVVVLAASMRAGMQGSVDDRCELSDASCMRLADGDRSHACTNRSSQRCRRLRRQRPEQDVYLYIPDRNGACVVAWQQPPLQTLFGSP
uniref:Uncharacterized protein n=1 Tax=Oryza sativa subsp. japonica TaxID=39947 RepID=Q6YZL3_ORYSJ|nr:hypothetical protein [Oryza sativa Japonica Group]BAD03770.1 hypothetical protein [Oryza sativa Japonica Group]